MKKTTLILSLVSFALIASTSPAHARKLLPRAQSAITTKAAPSATKTRGINAVVKFRADRRAIIVTFSNLSIISSASYSLSYNTNGTTQGVSGTISYGAPEPIVREILFGTCSNGICRYDTGITNARFVVTTTLKNGTKIVKSFKLKV